MAYISRPSAVGERDGSGAVCGFVWQGLPEEVTRAQTYAELRENLVLYARLREEAEVKGRTHYRTLLSFERQLPGKEASKLVREWLATAFPGTRAGGFVHQNTAHTHVHVWIDARKVDGRKLDLSAREYRRIDETWNRLYCRAFGREEREHLDKKQREGSHRDARHREAEQPEGRDREASEQATGRENVPEERVCPAAPVRAQREGTHEERSVSPTEDSRPRNDVPGQCPSTLGERVSTPGERLCSAARAAHDEALRAAEALHRDAARLDNRRHTDRHNKPRENERENGDREKGNRHSERGRQ